MKTYPIVDLTGDSYLNPVGRSYTDGSGTHQRAESTIKSISVHHDAVVRPHSYDSVARYRNEAAAHYNRLGPGLQYHYKIDNQGTIFKIRPHTTWLYAVGSAENVSMIAICLDGYFHAPHNQKPTREQYEALGQLLVKLCEQSPQFPATYPNVRPHRDYSQTACPGDTFAQWVYDVKDKASATRVPADAVYDWPSEQPSVPQPPTPPADNRPEWEKNFSVENKRMWTEGTATVIDLATNQTLTTVEDNKEMEIGGKTRVGGTDFYITRYWTSRNTYNKAIPAAQLKDTPDVIPTPPTPEVPPTPPQQDHEMDELKDRLAALEKLWGFLMEFFAGLGNLITTLLGRSKEK